MRFSKRVFVGLASIGMAIGAGAAIAGNALISTNATSEEKAYSLSFKDSGGSGDSSTALTTSMTVSNLLSDGSDYVSGISSTASVYPAKTGYGLKFGGSSSLGSITLSLTDSGKITATKFVVHAAAYGTDSASFTVNGTDTTTSDSLSTTLSDLTYSYATPTAITSIAIAAKQKSKCRFYVSSIDIYEYASSAVTALSVSPTSKSLSTADSLLEADYTTSVTKNGAAGTSADYSVSVGTKTGESYEKSADVVWGTTHPTAADNCLRFLANYPTVAGGSTYLTADVALTVTAPAVTGVTINKSTMTLVQNNTETLTATVTPTGAVSTVTWSSDNPSAATVDSSGVVTAVAVGTASITATSTSDNSKSASCAVSVTAYTPIGGIVNGGSYLITATVNSIDYILKGGKFTSGNSSTNTETYKGLQYYSATDAWTFVRSSNDVWKIKGQDTSSDPATDVYLGNLSSGKVSSVSGNSDATYLASLPEGGDGSLVQLYSNGGTNDGYLEFNTTPSVVWYSSVSTDTTKYATSLKLVPFTSIDLSSIEITGTPTTTSYESNTNFDPAGLTVTAHFSDSSTATVAASDLTWTPSPLTAGTTSVTGHYTLKGVEKTDVVDGITVVDRTVQSIAITTNPTKTTYLVGESFAKSGLVVTATYNIGDPAVITDYTLSPADGYTFTSDDIGTKTFTVSYTGVTSKTFNVSVIEARKFSLVTSVDDLVIGSDVAIAYDGDSDFAMGPTPSGKTYKSNIGVTIADSAFTEVSGMSVFTLGSVDTTTYTFNNSDGYLDCTVNGNLTSVSSLAGTGKWSISIASSIATIKTSSYSIQYNTSSPRFAGYSSSQGKVGLYQYLDDSAIQTWSASFISGTTAICSAGKDNLTPSTDLINAWSSLKTTYAALSDLSKNIFKANDGVGTDDLSVAVARYDYIFKKYGTAVGTDFADRNPSGVQSSSFLSGDGDDSLTTSIALISVLSIITLGSAGLIFYRSKKRD